MRCYWCDKEFDPALITECVGCYNDNNVPVVCSHECAHALLNNSTGEDD